MKREREWPLYPHGEGCGEIDRRGMLKTGTSVEMLPSEKVKVIETFLTDIDNWHEAVFGNIRRQIVGESTSRPWSKEAVRANERERWTKEAIEANRRNPNRG